MAREATQPDLVRIELRVGNRTGAPHTDGRRGHIFAVGEVDAEFPRWWKQLRAVPVPTPHGPFYLYSGTGTELECVWTNGAQAPEDVGAADSRVSAELQGFTSVSAALAQRRAEADKLEARFVGLQEQVTSTERRLAQLQVDEESIRRAVNEARDYATKEKSSLAEEVTAARATARKEKELVLDDLMTTVKRITALGDSLIALEHTTAENAMARRSLAHTHMTEALDLYERIDEGGRLALTSGDTRETPTDRIVSAFAKTIDNGSIITMIKEVIKAVKD